MAVLTALESRPVGRASQAESECAISIRAHIAGTVWRIEVEYGDEVNGGQTVVVIESMKMEMAVEAPAAGRVCAIHVRQGQSVEEGDPLLDIE